MKPGSKLWLAALGLLAAPLMLGAPAAAAGLPLTPAAPEPATAVDQQVPCVNYPGNIPCNLSTFSASLGIGG